MVKNSPSNTGNARSIPGWVTKIPHAATKTRHSQINNKIRVTLKKMPCLIFKKRKKKRES